MTTSLWFPLALLSAVFTAASAILGKAGVAATTSTAATLVRTACMFLTLLIYALITGKFSFSGGLSGRPLTYIMLSGVFGAITWLFFFWALKVGDASKVVPVDNLSLLFAAILAVMFLGERMTWVGGGGAILMVIGAVLVARG